jgi:cell division protease FtsH
MSKQNSEMNQKPERPNNPRGPLPPTPGASTGVFRNKNFILILFMILLGFFLYRLYSEDMGNAEITRTQFLKWMQTDSIQIKSLTLQQVQDGIVIKGERILTDEELKSKQEKANPLLQQSRKLQANTAPFNTHMLEVSDEQISAWEAAKGIEIKVIHETTGWLEHIFAFLPIILLILFFWMIMARQGGGPGGKGIFSFGKSRAKLLDPNRSPTTFKDVAGAEEAKQDLAELVEFLKNPKKFDLLGGRIPKGALLVGPPGTGKTLLARAVAGEAGVPFFSMSGSDFVEMFVGVGASRVRDLFETGKKHAPCIIFIDEIDAVGRQRGAGLGGGHDEREQTLNQLLVEMDGFAANEGVILIAATNRPDVLDKALLRPGRFDRQIVVNLPDLKGREEILKVHVNKRKVPLSADVDLRTVAKGTPGLAGADLENLVNEAALLAARFDANKVNMIDFEEARDKLWMGAERKTILMSEEERRKTAYHEAGHALINLKVKHADALHKITIIPRGRALGVTMSLPDRDVVSMSLENVQDQIAILMGGRGAEILLFNHLSTGASNDIERATELARKAVTVWGFSSELGPVSYGKGQEEIFLGREIQNHRDYSEATAIIIDETIRKIIDEQVKRVHSLLQEHKDELVNLAEALLEHEVLDREEIDKVLQGETLESTKKSRQYLVLERAERERRVKEKEKLKQSLSQVASESPVNTAAGTADTSEEKDANKTTDTSEEPSADTTDTSEKA